MRVKENDKLAAIASAHKYTYPPFVTSFDYDLRSLRICSSNAKIALNFFILLKIRYLTPIQYIDSK